MLSLRSLHRYISVLRSLERYPKTFDQIKHEYEIACEKDLIEGKMSSRVFLRDKEDILTIFFIDVKFCRSTLRYYLDQDDKEILNKKGRLIDLMFS